MGLILYFLTVRLFGLHENPWLRLPNGIIVAYGIYKVIKDLKAKSGISFNYFEGFKTGIFASFVAALIFTFFMGIYIFHIDTSFADKIMAMLLGSYVNKPSILLFIILMEGFAFIVILSLLFMQKFKPSWNIT